MVIIIDEREFSLISLFEKKETKFKKNTLEIGDILIIPASKKYGKGIIIERKEIDHDFFSSIYDGRLHAQIRAMKKMDARLILLLEGDIDGHQKKDEILKIIYNFSIFSDIHLLFTKTLKETYKTILQLNDTYREKVKERKKKWGRDEIEKNKNAKSLREIIKDYGVEQKKKFKSKEATFLRMMMEIPNISTETAVAIALFCDCNFKKLVKQKDDIENIKIPSSDYNISQKAVVSLSQILFE